MQPKYKKYLSNAIQKALPDEHGKAMIQMLVLKEGAKPEAITLKDHESYHDKSIDITLNKETSNTEGDYLHIYNRGNSFFFKSNKAMTWFVMADKSQGNFEADKEYEFTTGRLYTCGDTKIVPREIQAKAILKYVDGDAQVGGRKMRTDTKSAIIANLSYNGENKDVILLGYGKGTKGIPVTTEVGGATFKLQWGAKMITLPLWL